MKKKIDIMTQILQQNNLGYFILEGAKKKKPEDQNSKKGNSSHALIAINSCSTKQQLRGLFSFLLMISHILHGSTFSGKNMRSFNTSKISKPWLRHSLETRSNSSRTDNGGDYVNHEIHNLFHEEGIQLQHTSPYTPQQNKVVEWKNKSLKEMASCMLHEKSLPQRLWAEALNCETYIQNISPHRSVKDKTPYESWSSLKPEVTHFCIFSSRAWAQIPYEKRKARDP
jgi:hypothetical protein